MASYKESFGDVDNGREPRTLHDAQRAQLSTLPFEAARGDGFRWASLDVTDLDPPTSLLPYAAD